MAAPRKSPAEQIRTAKILFSVIDTASDPRHGLISQIRRITLLPGQQSLPDQGFQVYIIRISGKSRERLIRRISVSGRTDGQNLPAALSGFFQKINKSAGIF